MTSESKGGGERHRQTTGSSLKKWQQKTPDFRDGKLARQKQLLLYRITWNDNADAILYLPGGEAMLFLTDVDHANFEKAKEDVYKRQITGCGILHLEKEVARLCLNR